MPDWSWNGFVAELEWIRSGDEPFGIMGSFYNSAGFKLVTNAFSKGTTRV